MSRSPLQALLADLGPLREILSNASVQHPGTVGVLVSIHSVLPRLPGLVSPTCLGPEEETEYGSFTVWPKREAAETAGETIRDMVMPKLEGIATAPSRVTVMEIYEPG